MTRPPTIEVKFDPKTLPRWAQKHPAVVKLAARDLSFRCNIFNATHKDYQNTLIRQAESLDR